MKRFLPFIQKIPQQQALMISLLQKWADINSGSDNLAGLEVMSNLLKNEFSVLQGSLTELTLPNRKIINSKGHCTEHALGKALRIVKRPEAPIKVFLGGHMDTVYQKDNPFQKCELLSDKLMRGPGVADLKGGLVVMLNSLQVFEQTPFAKNLGWEILINPDEEIGSIGSASLLKEIAKRNHFGLIFEPALPDGSYVSARKGSINMTIVVKGKSAHVGREYHLGRNSIHALAHLIFQLSRLNNSENGTIVNVGHIEGGGPTNIVPNLAICRVNIRVSSEESLNLIKSSISMIISSEEEKNPGISIHLHEDTFRPPKPFNQQTKALFLLAKECGQALGINSSWKESGGVCDGNILAAEGLPVIDTLGVVGGNLHTNEEYINLDSLVERTSIAALLLMTLAHKG